LAPAGCRPDAGAPVEAEDAVDRIREGGRDPWRHERREVRPSIGVAIALEARAEERLDGPDRATHPKRRALRSAADDPQPTTLEALGEASQRRRRGPEAVADRRRRQDVAVVGRQRIDDRRRVPGQSIGIAWQQCQRQLDRALGLRRPEVDGPGARRLVSGALARWGGARDRGRPVR